MKTPAVLRSRLPAQLNSRTRKNQTPTFRVPALPALRASPLGRRRVRHPLPLTRPPFKGLSTSAEVFKRGTCFREVAMKTKTKKSFCQASPHSSAVSGAERARHQLVVRHIWAFKDHSKRSGSSRADRHIYDYERLHFAVAQMTLR